MSCSSTTPVPIQEEMAANEVTISLPASDNTTILVTDHGRLLKKAQIISSDGSISLYFDPGTILLDENKKPLNSIKVIFDPIMPLPPENAEIIGNIIDLQPQEAIINPFLKLALKYDPSALP
jgi:hypothetical protein